MPIYGNGRVALDLTATNFELNNLKINGAIVNGTTLLVQVQPNEKKSFDIFDDVEYKAAKYTILGKTSTNMQMCEVLISVPVQTIGEPLVSVYGVVHDDSDQNIFSYFTVTAERKTGGSNDIELFINSSINAHLEVTALRTYIK